MLFLAFFVRFIVQLPCATRSDHLPRQALDKTRRKIVEMKSFVVRTQAADGDDDGHDDCPWTDGTTNAFSAPCCTKNYPFCQDRLGTNIEKKEAFPAGCDGEEEDDKEL